MNQGSNTMTTISANSEGVTLINVFTVEPANQRRLVELLTEATEVSVTYSSLDNCNCRAFHVAALC
jgi:hypothetical protein